MNYTNGIGSSQQYTGATEAAALSSTSRATKAESGSLSTQAASGSSNAAPVDEANLSASASVITQALSGSDVRADKVAALQQSIAAGTYNVSSSDVAAKVLSALLN